MTAAETPAGPVMANGQPNPTGTGRYCPPAVCWCGDCPWWVPAPPPNYEAALTEVADKAARKKERRR